MNEVDREDKGSGIVTIEIYGTFSSNMWKIKKSTPHRDVKAINTPNTNVNAPCSCRY